MRSKCYNSNRCSTLCGPDGTDHGDRISRPQGQVHDHQHWRRCRFNVCLYGIMLRQHLCCQSEMLERGLNLRQKKQIVYDDQDPWLSHGDVSPLDNEALPLCKIWHMCLLSV